MKWAFWKRKRPRRKAADAVDAGPEPDFYPAADADTDEAAAHLVRVRTRRRLIGACALLLAAVILVPMFLDPTPRTVPDSIPIDLPSDRTPFAPRPPPQSAVPAPADAGVPAAPGSAADAAAETRAGGARRGRRTRRGARTGRVRAACQKHAGSKLFVQAGAMARQSAAQELASRLRKAGLSPFVERSETSEGVRYRVRLGPFATRSEAEHARARLRALGVECQHRRRMNGNVAPQSRSNRS